MQRPANAPTIGYFGCARAAVRSERHIEAMFASCHRFDRLLWKGCGPPNEPNPVFDRAWREGVDVDLILAANHDREAVRAAAFLREHGEEELAEMVMHQPDKYEALWAEGERTLVDDMPPEERPASVRRLRARLRLSRNAFWRWPRPRPIEWFPAWTAFCEAWKAVAPRDAVAAIQNLRDVGGIWYEESVSLTQRPSAR